MNSIANTAQLHVELGDEGTPRCFICLMDKGTDEPESTWVRPSPCSLAAHQDCIMAWVADCERDGRRLQCPVCKVDIRVCEPWDPAIWLHHHIMAAAKTAVPYTLMGIVGAGTLSSLGVYGLTAMQIVGGSSTVARYLSFAHNSLPVALSRYASLPFIGPVLLLSCTFPNLVLPMSLPGMGIYSSYLLGCDPQSFTWPPSPQAVLSMIPFLHTSYRLLYIELFSKWEKVLDTRINGLPPSLVDPPPAVAAEPAGDAEARRHIGVDVGVGPLDPEGLGLMRQLREMIQNVNNMDIEVVVEAVEAVEGDEDQPIFQFQPDVDAIMNNPQHRHGFGNIDGPMLHFEGSDEDEFEESSDEDETSDEEEFDGPVPAVPENFLAEHDFNRFPARFDFDIQVPETLADLVGGVGGNLPNPENDQDHDLTDSDSDNSDGGEENGIGQMPPNLPHDDNAGLPRQNGNIVNVALPTAFERQQNNAVNAIGSMTIKDFCSSAATAFLLPGLSMLGGELLRLALPRSWSVPPLGRPTGLLQTQWGRSFAGGCLYFILRDTFFLYTKYRKASIKDYRLVQEYRLPTRGN